MQYVTFPTLERFPNITHGMFTRHGGASKPPYHESNFRIDSNDEIALVRETYRRAGACLGFDPDRLVAAKQVHEDTVLTITAKDVGLFWRARPQCDGFITDVPGIPLGVFGADCQTILFFDPTHPAIGVCHAGWRGTAKHIAQKTVLAMQREYGSDPKNIRVAIGPHIHSCCYEVSEEVVTELAATPIRRKDKLFVELSDCVVRDLEELGVLRENLFVSPICTMCEHDRFWSHRAVAGGERGVCLAVIMLKEEAI